LVYFIRIDVARSIIFWSGVALVGVCFLYPYYVSQAARSDYEGMLLEHSHLVEKDDQYKNWKPYVEYRRSTQGVAAQQAAAWSSLSILSRLNPFSYF
jgi:hypothetical protein